MYFGNFLASSFLVLGASMSPPAADNAAASPNEVQVANNTVQGGQLLTHNTPTDVNGVETVCTGIDSDTRNDPRWAAYPLRLEFAAGNRAYVANETVSITGGGNVASSALPRPLGAGKASGGQISGDCKRRRHHQDGNGKRAAHGSGARRDALPGSAGRRIRWRDGAEPAGAGAAI